MKNFKNAIALVALLVGIVFTSNAQDKMSKIISLEQTKGEFTQKNLTVAPGTYVFEIANNNVGHDVGFVLVKKGQDVSKPENHIKTAYVTKAVANGKTEKSNATVLEKGEYVYFCPLNPTATDNTITVK
ncbi:MULTISPECIES: plastocyanin/azurin family copper-binding protein [unclassified Cellulophaga]|uniref:plastocyanin/azurin family copper-binding protein n=1 Tax=unclassified Cellulophaga TaxID=2634405 RepID=UPI0026E4284D|nr:MULTISPECIES: plastocyanin/azurin family copper-binding protein [unclassified Cellulophaga]MDO6491299.1 plastocyanin/azurin family copper-binding protein [Cellulophaga sp. 2_MG-2023]MDO6495168.1 plastocyanin/azurin family copper-binding protein [Cellulophaga sp. 3_MG-2023]